MTDFKKIKWNTILKQTKKHVFIDMYSCHSCTCLEYSIKSIRILNFYIQDDSSMEKYDVYEKLDGNKTKC